MARLVPATCPSCGGGIRLDPDDEIVTCTYCHTSSFVQTAGRRPEASDPRYTTVIDLQGARRRIGGAAVAAVVAVGVGVAVAIGVGSRPPTAPRPAPVPRGIAAPEPPPRPAPEAPRTFDLLGDDIGLVPTLFADVPERARALQMTVHPTHSRLVYEVGPGKADEIAWRRGERSEPEIRRGKLRQTAFSLDDIDLSALPAILEDATSRVELEEPGVSHVIVDEESGRVTVRIYVRGKRDSELLRYDAHGQFLR